MSLKYGWEELVKEGETLFEHMITNFGTMFDGESRIKHFDIESGEYGLQEYIDEIKEMYFEDIQTTLIRWIQHEFNTNELFINTNWKPFRDPDILTCMFLGYKKMFQYDKYMFQLSLKTNCDNDECDCHKSKKKDNATHFGLAFYGWKDERYAKLQPYNNRIVSPDMSMPASLWK